jgi:hypothetical protein
MYNRKVDFIRFLHTGTYIGGGVGMHDTWVYKNGGPLRGLLRI